VTSAAGPGTLLAMEGRTVVGVHAVGAGGASGSRIGWATLVEPGYALLDAPAPSPVPASVRVVVTAGGGTVLELFDAAARAVDGAPDLVLVELSGHSAAPVTPVPVADDPDEPFPSPWPTPEQLVAGLRVVLAAAPARPPQPPLAEFAPIPVEGLIELLRRLFHP
jgi:hypothetical protein